MDIASPFAHVMAQFLRFKGLVEAADATHVCSGQEISRTVCAL
ncbi:hypothetical protein DSW25_11735 [Sulfitobacter donghicola DSW-25 = KCTC 12864 = JCM 14565]|uniref:Uncharacterized protein n=1 Tax=Sulfitobacter donghicola DSW-25 = KCTC 12864 = JCM 14565 TaxID=1300350 RepID=A0A073II18_9RHOB|nr:hypothetical protein DSW25_11735 [Sulfitobacter donghicola DSW-25 = KCTC 12864 = JCM 14565]